MTGLEYVLDRNKIPYTKLAEDLGIGRQNVSLWATGERQIPQKHLDTIVKRFGVPAPLLEKTISESDKAQIDIYIYKNSGNINPVQLSSKEAQYKKKLVIEKIENIFNKVDIEDETTNSFFENIESILSDKFKISIIKEFIFALADRETNIFTPIIEQELKSNKVKFILDILETDNISVEEISKYQITVL